MRQKKYSHEFQRTLNQEILCWQATGRNLPNLTNRLKTSLKTQGGETENMAIGSHGAWNQERLLAKASSNLPES
jgi:hypothetical protein